MHGSFDKSGKSESFSDRWRIGFFVFPVVLAVALIALAILEPSASKWISEAAQAEFVGVYGVPEQWPHIRALYQQAGFAHTGHTEIVYLARVQDLPGPSGPPLPGSWRHPAPCSLP